MRLDLIPGTMCNTRLWRDLVPYLSDSLEINYLPIPLHLGIEEIVDYYLSVLGEEKLNLIGFSVGGYIAAYLAAKYPERINKLFVISNSPTSLPIEEIKQRRSALKWVRENVYKGMSRVKAKRLLDNQNQTDQLVELVIRMDAEQGQEHFVSQLENLTDRVNLDEPLSASEHDSHYYVSSDDPLVDVKWLEKLRNQNPRISLVTTVGSGHMLPLEKPVELAKLINNLFS